MAELEETVVETPVKVTPIKAKEGWSIAIRENGTYSLENTGTGEFIVCELHEIETILRR